jgi:hypothetical protein
MTIKLYQELCKEYENHKKRMEESVEKGRSLHQNDAMICGCIAAILTHEHNQQYRHEVALPALSSPLHKE